MSCSGPLPCPLGRLKGARDLSPEAQEVMGGVLLTEFLAAEPSVQIHLSWKAMEIDPVLTGGSMHVHVHVCVCIHNYVPELEF